MIVESTPFFEKAIIALPQELVIHLNSRNPRNCFKLLHKMFEAEHNIETITLLRESFKPACIYEFLYGSLEQKSFLINLLRKLRPIYAEDVQTHFDYKKLNDFEYLSLLADILEIVEYTPDLELPESCCKILQNLVEALNIQLKSSVEITLNGAYKANWMELFVQILKSLNSVLKVFKFMPKIHETIKETYKIIEPIFEEPASHLPRETLTQLYILLLNIKPDSKEPLLPICRIHYWNAEAIIKNANRINELLNLLSILKDTDLKFHIASILSKSFCQNYESIINKQTAFEVIMTIYDAGRSMYSFLEEIIGVIIANKWPWSLEGAFIRRFLICTVALKTVSPSEILQLWPSMLEDVIEYSGSMTTPYACECAELLFSKMYEECGKDYDRWMQKWIIAYVHNLTVAQKPNIKGITEIINPIILKIDRSPKLVQHLKDLSENKSLAVDAAIISLLKCYKELGEIVYKERSYSHTIYPNIMFNLSYFRRLLLSGDDLLTIVTLEFLAVSQKPTEMIPGELYTLFIDFYKYCIKTSFPDYRKNYLNISKKLLSRLRLIYNNDLAGKSKKPKPFFREFKEFLQNLISLQYESIHPDNVFEELCPSLELLTLIQISFCPKEIELKKGSLQSATPFLQTETTFYSENHFWRLIPCLHSSYEAIRELSFNLLKEFSPPCKERLEALWIQAVKNTTRLSMRHFEAASRILILLGCSYSFISDWNPICDNPEISMISGLLEILTKRYQIFKEEFTNESEKLNANWPHGIITSLAYAIDSIITHCVLGIRSIDKHFDLLQNLLRKMFELVEQILGFAVEVSSAATNTVVLDTINSQTQTKLKVDCRGHFVSKLLDSTTLTSSMKNEEEGVENELIVAFYLLTRELGLLLQSLGKLVAEKTTKLSVPTEKLAKLITNYFFALVNLKHMGSVDRISNGLQKISIVLHNSDQKELYELSTVLLHQLINLLEKGSFKSILRRSAGVPYAFTCLLKSESVKRKQLIELTINTLTNMSQNAENELKIHALNIMKKIFQDSDIKAELDVHVSSGFIVAIKGFTSEDWGVRNSSLMLFSCLMQRTAGIKPTFNLIEFFQKCPELFDFIKSEVHQLNKNTMYPPLYPITLLLSRLLPFDSREVRSEAQKQKKDYLFQLFPLIRAAGLANPNYMGRIMTAKASLPFLSKNNVVDYTLSLLEKELPSCSDSKNQIHSILSECYYILKSYSELQNHNFETISSLPKNLNKIILSLSHRLRKDNTTVVLEFETKIITVILQLFSAQIEPEIFSNVWECAIALFCRNDLKKIFGQFCDVGYSTMRQACIDLLRICAKIINKEVDLVKKLYEQLLPETVNNNEILTLLVKETSECSKLSSEELSSLYIQLFNAMNSPILFKNEEVLNQILCHRNLISKDQLALLPPISLIELLQLEEKSENAAFKSAVFKVVSREGEPSQVYPLLLKFSHPEQLPELRECCLEYFEESGQFEQKYVIPALRLLEDEEPELREQSAKVLFACLSNTYPGNELYPNQCILREFLLKKVIRLTDFDYLLKNNTDFIIKSKNYLETRIFGYDKPNKFRSDIGSLLMILTQNKSLEEEWDKVRELVAQYSLPAQSEFGICANEFSFEASIREAVKIGQLRPNQIFDLNLVSLHP